MPPNDDDSSWDLSDNDDDDMDSFFLKDNDTKGDKKEKAPGGSVTGSSSSNSAVTFYQELLDVISNVDEDDGDRFSKSPDEVDWKVFEKKWMTQQSLPVKRAVTVLKDKQEGMTILAWMLQVDGGPPGHLVRLVLDTCKESIYMKEKRNGDSPLHIACYNNASKEVVKALLEVDDYVLKFSTEQQKRQKKIVYSTNNDKELPLHYACQFSDKEIVSLLLEADNMHGKQKPTIHQAEQYGSIALHFACTSSSTETVKMLLEADLDKSTLYTANDDKRLPIHEAVFNSDELDVFRLLLDADTKEGKMLSETDEEGKLALHYACSNFKSSKTIKYLCEKDSKHKNYKVRDKDGNKPLRYLKNENMSTLLKDAFLDDDWMEILLSFSEPSMFVKGLVDNIDDRNAIAWLTDISCERVVVFVLMLQFYSHIAWLFCFTYVSISYLNDDMDALSNILALLLFPPSIVFFSIELRQLTQLYGSNALGSYFLDLWNFLDLTTIAAVVLSAYFFLQIEPFDTEYLRIFFCVTGALLVTHFLSYLKNISLSFSIFVGGLLSILQALIPFLVVLTILLALFAYMYHVRKSANMIIDDDGNDYTTFASSFQVVFLMLFSGPEDASSELDIIYGILIFVVLLNGVVLAVVSSKWDGAEKQSSVLFWQYRLQFIQEFRPKKTKKSENYKIHFDFWYDTMDEFMDLLSSPDETMKEKVRACVIMVISFLLGFPTFGVLWVKPIRDGIFCGGNQQNKEEGDNPMNKANTERFIELEKKMKKIVDQNISLQSKMDSMQKEIIQRLDNARMGSSGTMNVGKYNFKASANASASDGELSC